MLRNETIFPPTVIEQDGRTERSFDIYSRLLRDRIVFLRGPVTDDSANVIVAQLLYLSNDNPTADISIYINSPGGSVSAGMAIMDTMNFIRCNVATYCVGLAASMGAILLSSGQNGKRYCLPNSRVLIHQPLVSGVITGPATDLDIEAKEIIRLRQRLYEILAENTGQGVERVEQDCDRNKWLDADEAIEYGCVDKILDHMPESPAGEETK